MDLVFETESSKKHYMWLSILLLSAAALIATFIFMPGCAALDVALGTPAVEIPTYTVADPIQSGTVTLHDGTVAIQSGTVVVPATPGALDAIGTGLSGLVPWGTAAGGIIAFLAAAYRGYRRRSYIPPEHVVEAVDRAGKQLVLTNNAVPGAPGRVDLGDLIGNIFPDVSASTAAKVKAAFKESRKAKT